MRPKSITPVPPHQQPSTPWQVIGFDLYNAKCGIPCNLLQQTQGVFFVVITLHYRDGHDNDVHAIVYDAGNKWHMPRTHKDKEPERGMGILIDNVSSTGMFVATPVCFVQDQDRPTIQQVGLSQAKAAPAKLFQNYFRADTVRVTNVYLLKKHTQ